MEFIEKYRLPLEYVGLGKFIIYGFCPDFIDQASKVIVEIFGNYWHYKPEVYRRDKKRLATYKRCGYKTIVIWASELNDEELVLSRLSEVYDLSKS